MDRLVPSDELSLGGKDAGCAVFIDRQLAGDYGRSTRLYTKGPFLKGLPTQGYQGAMLPQELYRSGLAALQKRVTADNGGRGFEELTGDEQDAILSQLESGDLALPDVSATDFFKLLLTNTMEGFFADPLYGGNKDMTSWKMLGFPGARYDYRDFVSRHNEPYPLPPVAILGASDWNATRG